MLLSFHNWLALDKCWDFLWLQTIVHSNRGLQQEFSIAFPFKFPFLQLTEQIKFYRSDIYFAITVGWTLYSNYRLGIKGDILECEESVSIPNT